MTGAVHIERHADDPNSTKRKLTLIPTSGHIKGYSFEHWDLEDVVAESPQQLMSSTMESVRPWDTPSYKVSSLKEENKSESEDVERRKPGYSHTPLVAPLPAMDEETERAAEESAPESTAQASSAENNSAVEITETAETVTVNPSELPVGSGLDVDITDQSSFLNRLERAVASSTEVGDNFVLLALRMRPSGDPEDSAIGFEFLLDVVHDVLKPHDDMLVQMDSEQLIVFLAHTREEEADQFFETIRDHLVRESPQRGADLLTRISAMVSENGRPFASAAEFVTYAFIQN